MTALRNFDTDLDVQGVTRLVTVKETVPVVKDEVVVRPVLSQSVTFAGKPPADWSWEELRDYVVREIEARFGAFPRDSKKEFGIFSAFKGRWGAQAGPIAKFAFDVADGRWKGAPISVTRFAKGSDPYFSVPISERLSQ